MLSWAAACFALFSSAAPSPARAGGQAAGSATVPTAEERFVAFCYHDVVARANGDARSVEEGAFFAQIEYLRAQGAHFLSVDEIIRARQHRESLPARSVLLTFDDGCRSFHLRVLPLLRHYRIPSVLSVVTSWTEQVSGAECQDGVMSWQEIREAADSGLVEVASHTHDMHRGVPLNPLGSTAQAATTRLYDRIHGRYEDEAQHRARLARDLTLSARIIENHTGRAPQVLTWPFGAFSQISIEEGRRAGFSIMLVLAEEIDSGVGRLSKLETVPRRMLLNQPSLQEFARAYWAGGPVARSAPPMAHQRVVHADLDALYDANAATMRRNIDRFVERVVSLKPTQVYLQAFNDESGTGNVSSVYFPNRVLPVKADLFSYVARALQVRDVQVFAWMPSLSLVLPDPAETESLRVRERHEEATRPAASTYRRLSPFSEVARRKAALLFEDLAIFSPIDGVLFQDDAYLDEGEDFHPAAVAELHKLGVAGPVPALSEKQMKAWTARKTATLVDWTQAMMAAVRRHRPEARSARTLYAPVLLEPESERWFAQSYPASLKAYDEVVVMAYPLMEKVRDADAGPWLARLAGAARVADNGLAKTVFKLQTVDWARNDACVPAATLKGWAHALLQAGARHLAYYPDNLFEDCPRLSTVREFMSTEDFPAAAISADTNSKGR